MKINRIFFYYPFVFLAACSNEEPMPETTFQNEAHQLVYEMAQKAGTYQVYLNRETGLVDQFLFTVVDFGVEETPYLMQLEYEEIDGLLIPTVRRYVQANWEGEPLGDSWIKVNWTDVSFNNGLTTEIFQKPTL